MTEHPTREGKVYCAVVLDVPSRRVVGWSIDSSQTAAVAANAHATAIANRSLTPARTVIHSDHGVQVTSWAFTRRAPESGLVPSMGSIGDCHDNAVIEFWAESRQSCSTAGDGEPVSSWPTRCSSTSRCLTTPTPPQRPGHTHTDRVRDAPPSPTSRVNPATRLHRTRGTSSPSRGPQGVGHSGKGASASSRRTDFSTLLVGECQSPHLKFTTAAVPSSSYFIVARLYQRFLRLSVPPKRVVKFVESIRMMLPARPLEGGIQIKLLNSVLPASVKG
jgi:hypothetical protein